MYTKTQEVIIQIVNKKSSYYREYHCAVLVLG